MPPLTLAQDRLARGQNPTLRPTPGPSRPRSSLPRPDSSSPIKVRVPKGVPANDRGGKTRVEAGEEPTSGAKENEMWEDNQRRHKAAVILGSWEIVTWYGIAGDEVRLRFLHCLLPSPCLGFCCRSSSLPWACYCQTTSARVSLIKPASDFMYDIPTHHLYPMHCLPYCLFPTE